MTAVVTSRVAKPFICPCPYVTSNMCSALAKSICCASHPYQPCQTRGTSKARNANAVLSASKKPTTGPTFVPVTPSGTLMKHQYHTADIFVQKVRAEIKTSIECIITIDALIAAGQLLCPCTFSSASAVGTIKALSGSNVKSRLIANFKPHSGWLSV